MELTLKENICNCCHKRLIDNTINWEKYKRKTIVTRYGLYNKCLSCIKNIIKGKKIK